MITALELMIVASISVGLGSFAGIRGLFCALALAFGSAGVRVLMLVAGVA